MVVDSFQLSFFVPTGSPKCVMCKVVCEIQRVAKINKADDL